MTEYLVIVDTDSYAGMFERQLCAYMTGQTGECGRGENTAEIAKKELGKWNEWFDMNTCQLPDDHGVCRPVKLESTPGWFNDGMGGHYKNGTDPEIVKKQFEKACDETEYDISDIKEKGPGNHPCYQSIAIAFSEKPPYELRKILIDRAKHFSQNVESLGGTMGKWMSNFTVTDVRFVERTIKIDKEMG